MTWWLSAACCDISTDLFFAATPRTDETARRICDRCEVHEACLMTAMIEESSYQRRFGIFGGLDPGERHQLAHSGLTPAVAVRRLEAALGARYGAA